MLQTETHLATPSPSHAHQQRLFEQIAPRPPTPPKDSPRSKKQADRADSILSDDNSGLSSREISPPPSSAESASEKPKKRVSWSPWTKYHKDEPPTTPIPLLRQRSLVSAERKPLKSALKPYTSPLPNFGPETSVFDGPVVPHTYASFTSMLESVVHALASPERSKKIDTYIAFQNCLRAYDKLPDMNALEEKMPVICTYIRRDMLAKMEDGGKMDTQLNQQATKLAGMLSWTQELVDAMDDPNMAFFVMNALQKVEDPQTSKLSVNLYMHLLAIQKYPPRIMTSERANRLITALADLDDRVTGKAISKERIDVYTKLLHQSRQAMLARAPDWMEQTFNALTGSLKDTRERALVFLVEVTRSLPNEKAIARAVTNMFSKPESEESGVTLFETIRGRLESLVKEGEGIFVARMWSVILLLNRPSGDKWQYFNPWLRIIEGCFNVSDKNVKVQAQAAWSKLIYSMNIGLKSNKRLHSLLCKPLEQYLDPKTAVANSRGPRKAAMQNASVLLYYGFRPDAPWAVVSEIWDIVVVGVVQKLALASRDEILDGCSILAALFDGTVKQWNEPRVLGGSPMKPEEIPRLDPKWVRTNSAKVIQTLEVALRRSSWLNDESAPGARTIWQRFTKTLGDAGRKEIMISAETMEAVAHIFNMLQRIWNVGPEALAGPAKEEGGGLFIEKFTFLVEVALESLGPLCFTEKQLVYDEQTKFSWAGTPSMNKPTTSTSSSMDGIRYSPILHLFRLMLRPARDVAVDSEYFSCVRVILSKCCSSQDSRRKKLQLLSACDTMLPRRDVGTVDRGMWTILVELTRSSLPSPARQPSLGSPAPSGTELKDAVQILKWGSQYVYFLEKATPRRNAHATRHDLCGWEQLFNDLAATVTSELGEGAMAYTLIEPIAESLRYQKPDANLTMNLRRCKLLIEKASYPKKRQNVDIVSKLHYGFADRKATDKDLFISLYEVINQFLKISCSSAHEKSIIGLGMELFTATISFLGRVPSEAMMTALAGLQEGLGAWGADAEHVVSSANGLNSGGVTTKWVKTLRLIENLPRHDSVTLSHLQVLLASGLESRLKGTVDTTLRTWNATFGKQETLVYPRRVNAAMKRLRPIADISLPSLPEDGEDDSIPSPPVFSESQDLSQQNDVFSSPTPRPNKLSDFHSRTASPRLSSPAMVKETPFPSRGRDRRKPHASVTPTRPKHMDSQIEFAPIDNGADDDAMDSQVLTENQKEVKQKQTEAAALFPEISTGAKSPASKATGKQPSGAAMLEKPLDSQETTSEYDSDPGKVQKSIDAAGDDSFISSGRTRSPSPDDTSMQSSQFPSSPIRTSAVPAPGDPVPPDMPSENEDFVDAMEIIQSGTSSPAPVNHPFAEISVEVSPPEGDYETFPSAESDDPSATERTSADAQILAENGRTAPSPREARSRSKKRKRPSPDQPDSPPVLDTIVVSQDTRASTASRESSASYSQASPAKRAKLKGKAPAGLYAQVSPPKTRSATKLRQPPPKMLSLDVDDVRLPPAGTPRRRQRGSVDSSPIATPTPTPKRRGLLSQRRASRSASATPTKKQQQQQQQAVNTSFVQETQLDEQDEYPSSVADSDAQVPPTMQPGTRPQALLPTPAVPDGGASASPRKKAAEGGRDGGRDGGPDLAEAVRMIRALGEGLPDAQVVDAVEAVLDLLDPAVPGMQDAPARKLEDRIFDSFVGLQRKNRRR